MNKYGYNFRVEVDFWTRSRDGDDWIDGSTWFNFDTLGEAVFKAGNPFSTTKDLIESRVLDMRNSKYGAVIWKKDWINNIVTVYHDESEIKE